MVLPVGIAISLTLVSIIGAAVHYHFVEHQSINYYHISLAFFLAMNILVAIWEIGLGIYISDIEKYYKQTLLKKYKARNTHLTACIDMFKHVMTLGEMFSLKFWAERIWGTYSLYDTSYSNDDSYGFMIDVGNGWSTFGVSIYLLVGMTSTIWTEYVDPILFGIIGLIFYYQMFYGTLLYFIQFFYHRRHYNRSVFEVALFVGLSNGLWFTFPVIGMWCSANMVRTRSFDIVRVNQF